MDSVKVLFLASNPLQQSRLALDEEARIITAQIRSADHRDAIELISAWAVRRDDLQQLLLQHKPHILHFSGHGVRCTPTEANPPSAPLSGRDMNVSGKGQVAQLVLMGEGGQAEPMSEVALIHLLGVLKDNLRLVFLSACHSESLAKALADVIPYTMGMSGAIADDAAIAFAAAFYRALGFGRNLQEAFDLGLNALMNLQVPEDQRPRLYCRKDVLDPSKVVLIGGPVAPSRRRAVGADRNRTAMLEKVRTIWITGFLQKSLFQETRIVLGLAERPDAVARPLDLLVRRPDQGDRPLPVGTQVVEVFDSTDQALLILGAPGSGKTTLLLELARDLLDRAALDPAHPIPVVFPLSTWAESRKPLVEWLAEELNLRYNVPRKIAEGWVASDEVLPLLDGLDEVKAEHRDACVAAINAFRRSHGFMPLAIASRTSDYEALAERLRLHGAILVRPLTREQVNTYLADLGAAGVPVRAAIHEDPSLWDLLGNPLLLNVVAVAYVGQPGLPTLVNCTMSERRNHLFGLYLDHMFMRRVVDRRYTPARIIHWLSWLAHQMDYHGQTVFYLEHIQLDWLPPRQREAIQECDVLAVQLLFGLVGGLAFGLLGLPVFGLVVGLGVGLAFGRKSITNKQIKYAEIITWSWSKVRREVPRWLVVGLGVDLVLALIAGLDRLLVGVLVGVLVVGVVGGLVIGLVGGLALGEREVRMVPDEGIRRSARNALLVTLVFGLFGLVVGLGVGLVFGLFGLDFGLDFVVGRLVVGLGWVGLARRP
jgi:hypothetical protein